MFSVSLKTQPFPPKLWLCCLLKFKHFVCPRKIMNSVLRPSSKVNLNHQNANPYKWCTYDSYLLPSTHTHFRSGHWLSQHIWLFWYQDLRQIWKFQSSQNIIRLPYNPSSMLPHLNPPRRNALWFRPLLIFHLINILAQHWFSLVFWSLSSSG